MIKHLNTFLTAIGLFTLYQTSEFRIIRTEEFIDNGMTQKLTFLV